MPLDRATAASDVTVAELVDGKSVTYARGSGQANTYAASIGADGLEIDWWFPQTTNAMRTFVVRYVVSGAVRTYDTGDQLQWRAVYADRDGSVGSSTVTVHLPGDVDAAALRSAWYRYPAGTSSFGALPSIATGTQMDARTVQFVPGPLAPREGAEVRVQFPHGLIPASPPAWQAGADRADWLAQTVAPIGDFLALLLTLAILAGGAAVLGLVWFANGRDPRVGAIPARLDEPPSDLPAPLAGTLLDERADEKEAVAALVDLADRGLVHVRNEQNPRLVGTQADVRITLDVALDDARLRDYERVLLAALFGHAPSLPADVLLSDAKAQFHASIPLIEARLYESVAQAGLFARNPETTRRRWRAIGVTTLMSGVILALGAASLLAGLVSIAWLPGLTLALVGGALTWLAGRMPRRTLRGALEVAQWRAFRAHLAETSRENKPGVALPAHYLPYAVAFGVDQSYVRHLESVGSPPPHWFDQGRGGVVLVPGGWYGGGPWLGRGPHHGGPMAHSPLPGGVATPSVPNPQGWSDALAALLNAASEAMAHGGGPGGWSGGGFGGGGGGGGGRGGFR